MLLSDAGIAYRAQRFPLKLNLNYRKIGMREWKRAKTINISRSGILFKAKDHLVINDKLDIRIQMPLKAMISCHASLMRQKGLMLAVKIHHVHLFHKK